MTRRGLLLALLLLFVSPTLGGCVGMLVGAAISDIRDSMDSGGGGAERSKEPAIIGVAFTDGGKVLVVADPPEVAFWDMSSRELVAAHSVPEGHAGFMMSRDGSTYITVNLETSSVTVWDAKTGSNRRTIEKAISGVVDWRGATALSPRGRMFASSDTVMGEVEFWDTSSGETVGTVTVGRGAVALAFSPTGRFIAIGGSHLDGVTLWDTTTWRALPRQFGRVGDVRSLTFSPDGRLLAAQRPSELELYDLTTGSELWRQPINEVGTAIAFAPDGRTLARGDGGKTIEVRDVATGALLETHRGHEEAINSIAFSPAGTTLASSSKAAPRMWPHTLRGAVVTATPEVERRIIAVPALAYQRSGQHVGIVRCVAFHPGGELVASGGDDKTIRVWNARTGEEVSKVTTSDIVLTVTFSADGRHLIAPSDMDLEFWDVQSGKPVRQLHYEYERGGNRLERRCRAVAARPGTDWIATGHGNGRVIFWSTGAGHTVGNIFRANQSFTGLDYSADGKMLATASRQNGEVRIQVWDAVTTGRRHSFRTRDPVRVEPGRVIQSAASVAISPDGATVAAARLRKVSMWDLRTGKALPDIHGFWGIIRAVAMSSDGRTLAVAEEGGVVINSGAAGAKPERIANLAKQGGAMDVAFSPDGKLLASAGNDGKVRFHVLPQK